MDAEFNDEELNPFDIVYSYKSYTIFVQSLGDIRYYEWNTSSAKWEKMNPGDPDPPTDLTPGLFDGQIIEIPAN